MIKNRRPISVSVWLRILFCVLQSRVVAQASQPYYFPERDDAWTRRAPGEVRMNAALLNSAINFAKANESKYLYDLKAQLVKQYANDPFNQTIGPTKKRGGPNGLVIRYGYIVAEWGDTRRVDMTFSVTKSFLSAAAGIAFDRGLIKDVNDLAKTSVNDGGFDSPHNAKITWKMLLQQTSEWEGTLFGKPDMADRRRGRDRTLQEPGTFWEYNDIRVNRMALSLLRVLKKPLPDILKKEIMDPIGASNIWEYYGYQNSSVEIDGVSMQSVSGGGHYGGGWWVNSRDQARFGLLYLRHGMWNDRQLLSREWIRQSLTPCEIRPMYGYMWWLNTGKQLWPAAPERSFAALGAGTNAIYVDPDHDLVVVVRWIDTPKLAEFLARVLASISSD